MKEVKDMNLAEVAGEISLIVYGHPLEELMPYMSRIYELHKEHEALKKQTRWIPVSERMPTEEDGDENGQVFVSETENESPHRKYTYMKRWNKLNDPDYFHTITHWKCVAPLEDK
jgi:hypothetical protein